MKYETMPEFIIEEGQKYYALSGPYNLKNKDDLQMFYRQLQDLQGIGYKQAIDSKGHTHIYRHSKGYNLSPRKFEVVKREYKQFKI